MIEDRFFYLLAPLVKELDPPYVVTRMVLWRVHTFVHIYLHIIATMEQFLDLKKQFLNLELQFILFPSNLFE